MHQRGTFREEATKRDIQLANALGHQISHTANELSSLKRKMMGAWVGIGVIALGCVGRVFGWW